MQEIMEPVTFNGKTFANWKDYLLDKFSDSDKFDIENFNQKDAHIEHYRVTLKDKSSKTEIIYQIFKKKFPYVELFDVHFNHPDSPVMTEKNKANKYGFDGMGSSFDYKNLAHTDDWINIPLYHGWTERTTFFNGKEIKTDAIWFQNGKRAAIPLKQNYLNNYGCLFLPIIPFITLWNSRKLKWNSDKVKIKDNVIPAMASRQ